MSAYIVDREHIIYLIQAALSRRLNEGHTSFSWHWNVNRAAGTYERDTLHCNEYAKAAELGNMLWRENIASVSARYPNESSATLPGPIEPGGPIEEREITCWTDPIDPVQVLKACDCYEYQSCEHADWPTSQAKAFIESLRHAAWHSLPGYDVAEWGAPNRRNRKGVTAQ